MIGYFPQTVSVHVKHASCRGNTRGLTNEVFLTLETVTGWFIFKQELPQNDKVSSCLQTTWMFFTLGVQMHSRLCTEDRTSKAILIEVQIWKILKVFVLKHYISLSWKLYQQLALQHTAVGDHWMFRISWLCRSQQLSSQLVGGGEEWGNVFFAAAAGFSILSPSGFC